MNSAYLEQHKRRTHRVRRLKLMLRLASQDVCIRLAEYTPQDRPADVSPNDCSRIPSHRLRSRSMDSSTPKAASIPPHVEDEDEDEAM